ncbi:hypothetical protein LJR231_002603 [Phyllobacterium sp. LjRoot231]|uniref:hypothetical protein n=1 Tax=Phyllobacterium sp. LjRoot231 TaxID=3342289 RepID=UPI003ECDC9EC
MEVHVYQSAVIFAGLALVCLGAATQVWEYPRPRTDFGALIKLSLMLAVIAWFVHYNVQEYVRDLEAGRARGKWSEVIPLLLSYTILLGVIFFCVNSIIDNHYGWCLFEDSAVCTQKATTP